MRHGKIQAVVAGDFIGFYLTGADMQQVRAKLTALMRTPERAYVAVVFRRAKAFAAPLPGPF